MCRIPAKNAVTLWSFVSRQDLTHGDRKSGGLELAQGAIDSDTALALSLEFVQHPSYWHRNQSRPPSRTRLVLIRTIFEGTLAELSGFLLKFLNDRCFDTTALVDQVSSGGRLAGIDMPNDCDSR